MYKGRHKRSQWHSVLVWILTWIIIALLIYVAWINKNILIDEAQAPQEGDIVHSDTHTLRLGQEVAIEWKLSRTTSPFYTHILETERYGTLGVKSSSLDLASHDGHVFVGGEIVDLQSGIYVLMINTLVPRIQQDTKDETEINIGEEEQKATLTYIPEAGLLIHDKTSIFDISEGTNITTLTQKDGEESITIRSEICGQSCSTPGDLLVTTNEYGNEYKQIMETEVYVVIVNGVRHRITTTDVAFLQSHVNDIIFVQDDVIQDYIIPNAQKLCRSSSVALQNITDTVSDLTQVTITGTSYTNDTLTCIIDIALDMPMGGTLNSLKKDWSQTETQETETDSEDNTENSSDQSDQDENDSNNEQTSSINTEDEKQSLLVVDEEVEQFRTKPEDPFVFEFQAGYDIAFPAKNITFRSANIDQGPDIAGARCWIETQVWHYKQDVTDTTVVDPKISIFVCRIDNDELTLPSDIRYVSWSGSQYEYLIQAHDPARYEFANQTDID